ncbi:MAG: DCC1-like thiol-disulfide oxidoreductase family protein [Planctomycetota bacterium]|nr:DCC1-like thiol-disulfide oxidoreductase family protein [Planctomycetota bacterium]
MSDAEKISSLTVFYDNRCGFCAFCRDWLSEQRTLLHLHFRPLHSADLVEDFPELKNHSLNGDLLVRDNLGGYYQGPDAFIMVLFACQDYRDWSLTLSTPRMKPLAKAFFRKLSSHRTLLSRFFPSPALRHSEEACQSEDCRVDPPKEERWIRGESGCAKNCSYCRDCLTDSETMICVECETRVHLSCLEEMKQCPTLGCRRPVQIGRPVGPSSSGRGLMIGLPPFAIWAFIISQAPFLDPNPKHRWDVSALNGYEVLLYLIPIFLVPLFLKGVLLAFKELSLSLGRDMVDAPQLE